MTSPQQPKEGRTRRATLTGSLWRVARTLLLAYVGVVLVAFFFQRRLQYFPSPQRPSLRRVIPGLEEVSLTTTDGVRLEAWYWPGERPATLVIFHGNGGHRGHRLEWVEALHALGWGVFILDYRGYGGSEGSPSEDGLYHDAEAALAWLKSHTVAKQSKIVLFGESLGGGVAVEMARRHPPAALLLQSAFSSAIDVGKSAYPFLPVSALMRDRFENVTKIGEVQCPLLMIHGNNDSIVPMRFGRKLFDAANEPKKWYEVEGAGHNDLLWVGGDAYFEHVHGFLREVLEER
jgi:fermentation-respiration switch protein FrsA (DUF1100 family)